MRGKFGFGFGRGWGAGFGCEMPRVCRGDMKYLLLEILKEGPLARLRDHQQPGGQFPRISPEPGWRIRSRSFMRRLGEVFANNIRAV